MSRIFASLHIGFLHSHLSKSPVPCGYLLFAVLLVTLVCMYVQYVQGLFQSRLSVADRALTHVAHVTKTA
jgi:hypothetical protein